MGRTAVESATGNYNVFPPGSASRIEICSLARTMRNPVTVHALALHDVMNPVFFFGYLNVLCDTSKSYGIPIKTPGTDGDGASVRYVLHTESDKHVLGHDKSVRGLFADK